MNESSPPKTATLARRLTILYMTALGTIALLTIIGQLVVQRAIIQLEGDSRIVNIAGRQRMLSQRLTRLTLELTTLGRPPNTNPSDPMDRDSIFESQSELVTMLERELETWTINHGGLQYGSAVLHLPGKNSESVGMLFKNLTPHFEALRKTVASVLNRFSTTSEAVFDLDARRELSFHSDAFLAGMDNIVTRIEQEARDRVNRLRWIERVLLFATMLVLLGEGLFVFSPAVASLSRSLTQLHSISDELKKAKVTAEKANMAKTDFLARVSHELRTPLHAILGMLGLVEHSKLKREQSTQIRFANEAATSLLSLVDDLLDVASIEQGKEIVLHPVAVNIRELITSIAEVMRPMASQKGLQFQLTLADALPPTVTVDANRLRQVLTNLLQNAIRYTSHGHVRCFVDTQTEAGHWNLRMVVEDTGVGISAERQEPIFERFNSGSHKNASNAFGHGMGLGLSITQAMVKKLNGSISLMSVVGKGSQFTVVLPIQCAPEDEKPLLSNANIVNRIPRNLVGAMASKPTALIVDDSRANLLVMQSYLKQLGYRTMSVSSLNESVRRARKHHFDFVLMDRQLPDGDGLDFPKMLTSTVFEKTESDLGIRLATTKIILVTAEIHLKPKGDGPLTPFASVLYKPVSLSQLKQAIESASEGRGPCGSSQSDIDEVGFNALRMKLARHFIETLPGEIASIKDLIEKCDYSGVAFVAHRIIGSAGNADLVSIAKLGARLQAAAIQEKRFEIDEVLAKFDSACDAFNETHFRG